MLLGELPKGISAGKILRQEFSRVDDEAKPADMKDFVLNIIKAHTEADSGIGRTAILWELSKQGIKLSDDKARKLLRGLQQEGLIEIGKGRRGCRAI